MKINTFTKLNGLIKTQLLCLILLVPMLLSAQVEPLPMHSEPYSWDFGEVKTGKTIIKEHVVEIEDAQWLRIFFKDVNLGENSYVILTSLLDGAKQKLNAESMKHWKNSSAYFNGNQVKIEFFVLDKNASLEIDKLQVGDAKSEVDIKSQCGSVDNRVRSYDKAIGRIVPKGCTGWIIKNGLHVTAGHCVASNAEILEFNVPLSNSDKRIVHPDPEHQYVIDKSSWIKGAQDDWAVFKCYKNSKTNKSTLQAQGKSFDVIQKTSGLGTIRITGFGIDQGNRNQVQQTHTGTYKGIFGTQIRYDADTEGGNSGSPVIEESTGKAIGVHTNGGCSSLGYNNGTSAKLTEFWSAMNLENIGGDAPIGEKIYLRGNNGKYVSSENGYSPMICNRNSVQGWEQFTVVNAGNGKIALKGSNGKYVSSENGYSPMNCNRSSIQGWEKFTWVKINNSTVALKGSNGKYVSSEDGLVPMICSRSGVQGWEQFSWGTVESVGGESAEALSSVVENSLKVYPNPTNSGILFIEGKEDVAINVRLINLQGQVIQEFVFQGATTYTLDLPTRAKGVYILLIESSFGVEKHKVIIE